MLNHYPFHIGDYIKSTPHLSNEADLCYRRLIELYYDTEKPIGLDLDAIANRIRCQPETVKKVIAEFFTATKAGFKNKRCDAEIRQYYVKVKANRINGKLGGRPKKTQSVSKTKSVNLANPTITQTNLNQNQNQNQNQIKENISASASAEAPQQSDSIPYKNIVELYHGAMSNLAKVRELTPARKTAIRSAWQASQNRRSLDFWKAYFEECADDRFLNGTGPYLNGHENWRPTFDYLLKPKTVTLVYEKAMDRLERAAA